MKSKIAKLATFVLVASMLIGMVVYADETQTKEALMQRIESAFCDENIKAIISSEDEDGICCTTYKQLYDYFVDEVALGADIRMNGADGAWYVSIGQLFTSKEIASEWKQYYDEDNDEKWEETVTERTEDELKEFCAKAKEYFSAMEYGKWDSDLAVLCDTLEDNLGYKLPGGPELPENYTYLMFSTGKLMEGDTSFAKAITPNEENRYIYISDVFAVVENADSLESGTLYMLKTEMEAFEERLDATWQFGKHTITCEADVQTYRNKCFNLFEEIVNAIKVKEDTVTSTEISSIEVNNTGVSQEGTTYIIEDNGASKPIEPSKVIVSSQTIEDKTKTEIQTIAETKAQELLGKDVKIGYIELTLVDSDSKKEVTLVDGGKIHVTFIYPEGMDSNDEYKLLHWNGNSFDEPKLVKKDTNGVIFELTAFSPYVLLAKDATAGGNGSSATGGNTNTGNSSGSSSSGSGSKDSAEASESQNTPVETYEAPVSTVSQQLVNVPQTADTFPMTLLLMATAVCMLALGVTYGKSKKEI